MPKAKATKHVAKFLDYWDDEEILDMACRIFAGKCNPLDYREILAQLREVHQRREAGEAPRRRRSAGGRR